MDERCGSAGAKCNRAAPVDLACRGGKVVGKARFHVYDVVAPRFDACKGVLSRVYPRVFLWPGHGGTTLGFACDECCTPWLDEYGDGMECRTGSQAVAKLVGKIRGVTSIVSPLAFNYLGEGVLCDADAVKMWAMGWDTWVAFGVCDRWYDNVAFRAGYTAAADANERGGMRPSWVNRARLDAFGME